LQFEANKAENELKPTNEVRPKDPLLLWIPRFNRISFQQFWRDVRLVWWRWSKAIYKLIKNLSKELIIR